MAGFTKGPAAVDHDEDEDILRVITAVRNGNDFGAVVEIGLGYVDELDAEQRANADLFAAAINAGTDLDSLGYDGQAAIEALVEMVDAIDEAADALDNTGNVAEAHHRLITLLTRIRKGGDRWTGS